MIEVKSQFMCYKQLKESECWSYMYEITWSSLSIFKVGNWSPNKSKDSLSLCMKDWQIQTFLFKILQSFIRLQGLNSWVV